MSDKIRGYAINIMITVLFLAGGWMGRGWLEEQSQNWDNTKFTMQVVVPVILAAGWFATHDYWIKSKIIRFVLDVIVIIGLGAWFVNLTQPANYEWTDGLPVVAALVGALVVGVSILAWAKPYLAGWPLFTLPRREGS